ncbi:MAG: TPM domain-containing protein [Planctomycetota bacterium]|nr:TPM domain-containing protein [Planctomycetota bacterium]
MKHAHLIDRLDEPRILAAIAEAEAKSTGHIRVMVSKRGYPDALAAAEKHFKILKLDKSPQHNTVLIFVAPKSQTFAIYGDAATHQRCGPEFWNILRDDMTIHLKDSRYTEALVHAITKAGDLLAIHFPPAAPKAGA